MRCFYLILSSALLVSVAAWAGPRDVIAEPLEAELKPHHQLQPPALKAAPKPLPQPPAPNFSVEPNRISISDGPSLLSRHGIVIPSEAGFTDQVWQYMDLDEAKRHVAELDAPIDMKMLDERIVTLLMLEASAPEGADIDWLIARLNALIAMDANDQALDMLSAIPESLSADLPAADKLQLYLALKKPKAGCAALNISELEQDAQLFCDAINQNFSKVELSMALAKEQGASQAEWLTDLVEYIQYRSGDAPKPSAAKTSLAKLMIASVAPPEPKNPEAKSYPRKPAYALMVLSERMRQGRLDDADEWLGLLERNSSDSAATFVTHELVRFLRSDVNEVRSPEANQLPPFTKPESASREDKALLKRFYRLMEAFDYRVPEATTTWLSQSAIGGKMPSAGTLEALSKAGNRAGYLMELVKWLEKNPLDGLSDDAISQRISELRYLREASLAKQLLAESVLTRLE